MSAVTEARRVVVKVGTSTLTYENGKLNLRRMETLCKVLSDLQNAGREIILVSSGAIGVGVGKLGLPERPTETRKKQALAAVGQCELMFMYDKLFSEYGHVVAQVLLTRFDVDNAERKHNIINTFSRLLDFGTLPIVNENDTVAIEELDHLTKFGDNDQLSAIVCQIVQADLLVMLSDIDGFFSDNPTVNKEATLFSEINEINEDLFQLAGGKGSRFGTGGMSSKLKAAERVLANQQAMILANGKQPKIIFEILEGKDIGTLFIKGGHESD